MKCMLKLVTFLIITCSIFPLLNESKSYALEIERTSKNPMLHGDLISSAFIADETFIVVGHQGRIRLTKDGGQDWKKIDSHTTSSLLSVCFSGNKDGWISGKSGLILNSIDGGMTWQKQNNSVKKHLFAVDFINPNHGCAVGDWGAIVMTVDGGKKWVDSSLSEDLVLYDIKLFDEKEGCIVGEMGRIFITQDGGKIWQEVDSPVSSSLFSLTKNGDILYSAGLDGIVIYSTDQGVSWSEAKTDTENALYDISIKKKSGMNKSATGWAVGSLGTVLYSDNGGRNWTKIKVPGHIESNYLSTLSLSNKGNDRCFGVISGQKGSLIRIKNNKLVW